MKAYTSGIHIAPEAIFSWRAQRCRDHLSPKSSSCRSGLTVDNTGCISLPKTLTITPTFLLFTNLSFDNSYHISLPACLFMITPLLPLVSIVIQPTEPPSTAPDPPTPINPTWVHYCLQLCETHPYQDKESTLLIPSSSERVTAALGLGDRTLELSPTALPFRDRPSYCLAEQ